MILALLAEWWYWHGHQPSGALAQYWADDDHHGATFVWNAIPNTNGRVHIALEVPLSSHTYWFGINQ